jgi:MFS family permease
MLEAEIPMLVEGTKAAARVSLVFCWVSLLIALVPSLLVASATGARRWHYAVAGLLGGVAGGFSGTASIYLSLWLGCRSQVPAGKAAPEVLGLFIAFPVGSLLGCLVALLSMRLYCGPRPLRNWAYAIGSQLAFLAAMIFLVARFMA